jgi:hypothetical protein
MEVMDACMDGRFVHMGCGYYIIDRNNKDVIIGFDGTRTPAPVHQEGRNSMDTYYSIRAMLMSAGMKDSYESMYHKSHTDQWMEEARKKGRILHTNGAYTVIFNGQSVVWVHQDKDAGIKNNQYAVRHGYVLVQIMDKVDSWKYLQAMGMHTMAKELETFSW